ncbi:MAG TPA: hypothetical protein PKN76_10450, partial [bacterium]|nr:hypothetical protein [bacterium]
MYADEGEQKPWIPPGKVFFLSYSINKKVIVKRQKRAYLKSLRNNFAHWENCSFMSITEKLLFKRADTFFFTVTFHISKN